VIAWRFPLASNKRKVNVKSRIAVALFVFLLVNAAYIGAFAHPTVFYMTNVLLHLAAGILFVFAAFRAFDWRQRRPAAAILIICAALGLYLVQAGNTFPQRWALWSHIVAGVVFAALVIPWHRRRARALALLILLPLGAAAYRKVFPNSKDRIRNPRQAPVSMAEEGGGPKSPFWPSSSRTNVGGTIPSNFFMDSELCGKCHKDIYEQWNSSVHHFASFNNQFYRKSIEYMQSIAGTQPTKWCAGCHDHAVFFNGRFEQPIKDHPAIQLRTSTAPWGTAALKSNIRRFTISPRVRTNTSVGWMTF
jgi:hypothetical protein